MPTPPSNRANTCGCPPAEEASQDTAPNPPTTQSAVQPSALSSVAPATSSQDLMDTCIFVLFWAVFDHFEVFLAVFGSFQGILDHFGTFLRHIGSLFGHFETTKT